MQSGSYDHPDTRPHGHIDMHYATRYQLGFTNFKIDDIPLFVGLRTGPPKSDEPLSSPDVGRDLSWSKTRLLSIGFAGVCFGTRAGCDAEREAEVVRDAN
ncbi:hypothetical protein F2Q69_00031280 [Brassica cretica]|uniref:Uncharacterized protein n=1 Tax=Brassica cretica TaxID=69181 RepID=A0A8S9SB01_BRACR|nr:hypothetical protein F2Q69_00031280 [Brassica cretica]